MNSEKIIDADRNFVRKLHQLRSKLDVRQKENEKRSSGQVFHRSIVLTITILMIAGVGYAIIHNQQDGASAVARQRTVQAEYAQVPQPQTAGPMAGPQTGKDEWRFESESHKNLSAIQTTPASSGKLLHAPLENEKSKIEGANERLPSTESGAPVVDMKNFEVVSAVVCGAVKDRSPVDDQRLFYLSDTSRAYVWMAVSSKEQPFVLKHMYYLNGRKYCEVPLEIKYSWMRTWSYVTLRTKKQTGVWRVEIVGDDRVLKTVGFIVRDGDGQNG